MVRYTFKTGKKIGHLSELLGMPRISKRERFAYMYSPKTGMVSRHKGRIHEKLGVLPGMRGKVLNITATGYVYVSHQVKRGAGSAASSRRRRR